MPVLQASCLSYDYISNFLQRTARQILENPPKTSAELVAYWHSVGVIGSRTDITDSQLHARKLRQEAEKRYNGVRRR